MNQPITHWRDYFTANKAANHDLPWSVTTNEPAMRTAPLAQSLSHFRLGESGEGKRIRALAAAVSLQRNEPAYAEAVTLFVREENRHADLLANATRYLGGTQTDKHWTETAFVFLRRLLSLPMEVQVLAVAEIIGLAFYTMIGAASRDERVQAMCRIFDREETQHLAFDADSLFWLQNGKTGRLFRIWARLVYIGAIRAAYIDHRQTLQSHGYRYHDWIKRCGELWTNFTVRRG